MPKKGETKQRIYELLKYKTKIPKDVGIELGLSSSTAWQHMHEMLEAGVIRVAGGTTRKYYELNLEYK